MSRLDETRGLEALQRLRAQAVEHATTALAVAARGVEHAADRQAAAEAAAAHERAQRVSTLAAEQGNSRGLRAEDLARRGAWLRAVDARIGELEAAASARGAELCAARATLEGARQALVACHAELRLVEMRLEALGGVAARERERAEEDTALELYGAGRM